MAGFAGPASGNDPSRNNEFEERHYHGDHHQHHYHHHRHDHGDDNHNNDSYYDFGHDPRAPA
jgi:hypothetical protein